MIRSILAVIVFAFATPLLAADAKSDVKAAAKKLGDASGYAWHSATESAGGAARFNSSDEGKTDKDGYVILEMTRGENKSLAALKGGKGAVKRGEEEWRTLAELSGGDGGAGGRGNIGRFIAIALQSYKAPAVLAESLADASKEIAKTDDGYAGELSEEGAKNLMSFGARPGAANGPAISNPKASAKFWVKDGILAKFQYHVQGTMTFNGNDIAVDRTTTIEIKDVGSTKVDVPEEAKKKLQ